MGSREMFLFFHKVWREYAKYRIFEVCFPIAAPREKMEENNEEIAATSLHVQMLVLYLLRTKTI